jgi:hypothetical protein
MKIRRKGKNVFLLNIKHPYPKNLRKQIHLFTFDFDNLYKMYLGCCLKNIGLLSTHIALKRITIGQFLMCCMYKKVF